MIEFAIAAFAMLLFVFGIIEFGRLLYTYHTLANAAKAGTRWAIVRGSDCVAPSCPAEAGDVTAYVETQTPMLDPSQLKVETSWSNTASCTSASAQGPGCLVTVKVTYPFTFAVPLVSDAQLTLSASSQMTIAE
jgi:Flp pilus assembly protein TadG